MNGYNGNDNASKKMKVMKFKPGSLSEEELIKLSQDIKENLVFGTWNMKDSNEDLFIVFPMLRFVKSEELGDIGHFYGYYRDAAPRSCNGLPIFLYFYFINHEDALRLKKIFNENEPEEK